ncbi:MAG TPA: S8 family serine peptidase [Verrucomicrobiae bacterium]|nr:S8 family serine peptidase [Verrucomicrobiae bacterium]
MSYRKWILGAVLSLTGASLIFIGAENAPHDTAVNKVQTTPLGSFPPKHETTNLHASRPVATSPRESSEPGTVGLTEIANSIHHLASAPVVPSRSGSVGAGGAVNTPEPLSPEVLHQISELQAEKLERTPAQQRINSNLLLAAKRENGTEDSRTQSLETNLKKDTAGRVLVDMNASVSSELTGAVTNAGGAVVNSFPEYQSIRCWVPLSSVETLASRDDVKLIRPAVGSRTHAGSVTSEGDAALKADVARSTFHVTGAGVKVGVLSDSVDYLSNSQSSGDLSSVTVLPGQSGSGAGEGTAMLEIIHDLAPGANLYFATADNSPAAFASNIKALWNAGCDIIVDDVGYLDEAPFQDGIIAQAVNTVTANGALYFSAAGNYGNKAATNSGTWEGDFAEGGAYSGGGKYHSFGSLMYNTITSARPGAYAALFWNDPLGKSTNDYDLYIVSSSGRSIIARSDDYQHGASDPAEIVDQVQKGQRVVVVLSSGIRRFLHVDTGEAQLAINTDGNVRGHACAPDAFCVAAMSIESAGGGAFLGGLANPLETFTSDGPRRIFYASDGTPLTPDDFTATGGVLRQKPDLTAADGVSTSVPGFSPFFGTSAAAPHAAAVAALVKSYKPSLNPSEIRAALMESAVDVDPAGPDEDSGAGIVTALGAIQQLGSSATGTGGGTQSPGILSVSSQAGLLDLKIDGPIGATYQVEVSSDLVNWTPVQTVTNQTGTITLNKPVEGGNAFYRVRTVAGAS